MKTEQVEKCFLFVSTSKRINILNAHYAKFKKLELCLIYSFAFVFDMISRDDYFSLTKNIDKKIVTESLNLIQKTKFITIIF